MSASDIRFQTMVPYGAPELGHRGVEASLRREMAEHFGMPVEAIEVELTRWPAFARNAESVVARAVSCGAGEVEQRLLEACGMALAYGMDVGSIEYREVLLDKYETESGDEKISRLARENQELRAENERLRQPHGDLFFWGPHGRVRVVEDSASADRQIASDAVAEWTMPPGMSPHNGVVAFLSEQARLGRRAQRIWVSPWVHQELKDHLGRMESQWRRVPGDWR